MKTWLEKKGKLVFTEPPLRELVEWLKDWLYSVEIIREKNQRTANYYAIIADEIRTYA